MNGRGKVAIVALSILIVYLLATLLREEDKREQADRARDKALSDLVKKNDELLKTQEGIVAKLTEVFSQPGIDTQRVIDSVKNFVSPALIEQAVRNAGIKGATGETGKTGPQGPPGKSSPSSSSTTSTINSTTTTTTARPTTSSSNTTTSTTRPPEKKCSVVQVQLLGLCV